MAKTTFIVSFYWFFIHLSASAQDNKQPKTQENRNRGFKLVPEPCE
jgi:hypothetical protein